MTLLLRHGTTQGIYHTHSWLSVVVETSIGERVELKEQQAKGSKNKEAAERRSKDVAVGVSGSLLSLSLFFPLLSRPSPRDFGWFCRDWLWASAGEKANPSVCPPIVHPKAKSLSTTRHAARILFASDATGCCQDKTTATTTKHTTTTTKDPIRSDPIRPTHRNVSSIVPISVTVTTTKPNRNHGPSRIYRHRCCLPVPFYGHHSLSAVLGLSGPATAPIACPQRLSFVHEDDCRLWCVWIDSIRVCLPGSAER